MFCCSKCSTALIPTVLALVVISCTQDPPGSPPTIPPPVTPPTVLHDSTLLFRFITFNYSLVPDTVFEETFYYDIATKRISQVFSQRQDPGGSGGPLGIERDTLTYYYNGPNDTLARKATYKSVRYRPNGTYIDESLDRFGFGYDNTGRLTNDTAYLNPNGSITSMNRYVYVNSNEITRYSKTISGGISTQEFQSSILVTWQGNNISSQGSIQISYDDKRFPFYKVKPYYPFIPTTQPFTVNSLWAFRHSKNNPVQTGQVTTPGGPLTNVKTYSYTYRPDGFPIKMTRMPTVYNDYYEAVFKYY